MALQLDISCNKLTIGETITFTTIGNAGTYVLNVIDENITPATLEIKQTANYVPAFDIAKVSVQRLSDAINDITRIVSVTTNDTVISIVFESGVTDITFIGTSNCIPVKKIEDNGTVTNFGNPLVSNITITSVLHNLTDFATPQIANPHGLLGDDLTTEIYFTTADTFNYIDFFYGWVDNDKVIYPNLSDLQIDISNFEDITTGVLQKYSGDVTTINAVQPLQGNKVTSINLVSLGGNDYRLDVIHVIPILPRPTDVNNGTLDKPAEITTSLKMPFQIVLKDDLFDTNAKETTALQNLNQFIPNGNIGQFNQVQNTGLNFNSLGSIVWDNVDNQLNSGANTKGTIVINNNNFNYTTVYDVLIKIVELTDVYDQSKTLLENEKFEVVQLKMDNTPVSTSVFINTTATFSGNQATINFEIAAGSYANDYALWVEVGSGTGNFNQENILAEVGTAINIADDTTVIFGTYPGSTKVEYNYNNHYQLDIAESFNQVKSYIDDFQLSRFRVVNNDIVNNELVSFTISIKSGNNTLDSFEIQASELNYTFDRNYNLATNDLHRFVKVDDDGAGNYDFIYPFQINDNFVGLTDVVQETIAVFNQTTATGIVQFSNTFISPVFQFGQYDLSNNTVGEPQITVPPANIKYYNQAGTEEVGKVLNTGITKVVATFTETNLTDLQCDPPAPFTYVDNVFINDYICAYFGIESNGQYYRYHNLQDNGVTPFLGTFPILERVSISEATLTAFIDAEDIITTFGTDFDCLKITSRIDKIQLDAPTTKAYKNSAYSSGYS